MQQLQHIEAIEKRLWKAANTLRSNSELASNVPYADLRTAQIYTYVSDKWLAGVVAIL